VTVAAGNKSLLCRIPHFSLASVWCLGLATGLVLAIKSRDVIAVMMRAASVNRVSIVYLGLIVLIPLIISALAVVFSVPEIVCVTAFLDSVSLGFCLAGAVYSFGAAGGLVLFLLSFSKICVTVPKLLLYIRCVSAGNDLLRVWFYTFVTAVFFCLVDYFVVSNFLIKLLFGK